MRSLVGRGTPRKVFLDSDIRRSNWQLYRNGAPERRRLYIRDIRTQVNSAAHPPNVVHIEHDVQVGNSLFVLSKVVSDPCGCKGD